jgi:hypothetical protein
MQYTIRNIPEKLDSIVREQSRKYQKSMNALLLEALAKGLGTAEEQITIHDMDELAGTWVEDEAFDEAIASFETVDGELWK